MDLELSTYQAKAGYTVCEQYNDSKLYQLRGVAEGVAARWLDGQDFEDVMETVVRQARAFYAQGVGRDYPVSKEVLDFCYDLILACEVELPEPSGRLSHGSGGV